MTPAVRLRASAARGKSFFDICFSFQKPHPWKCNLRAAARMRGKYSLINRTAMPCRICVTNIRDLATTVTPVRRLPNNTPQRAIAHPSTLSFVSGSTRRILGTESDSGTFGSVLRLEGERDGQAVFAVSGWWRRARAASPEAHCCGYDFPNCHTDIQRQPGRRFPRPGADEHSDHVDRWCTNLGECHYWSHFRNRCAPAGEQTRPMVSCAVARGPIRFVSFAGARRLFAGCPALRLANH